MRFLTNDYHLKDNVILLYIYNINDLDNEMYTVEYNAMNYVYYYIIYDCLKTKYFELKQINPILFTNHPLLRTTQYIV